MPMDVTDSSPTQMISLMVRFWCESEPGPWRVMIKPVGSEEVRHFASVAVFIVWVEDNFGRIAPADRSGGE